MQPLQDFLTPPPPTATLPPAGGASLADATATPIPPLPGGQVGAQAQAAADTAAQVSGEPANAAAVLALLIYLAFFGAAGYRRGTQRELIVLLVALTSSFVLQTFSSVVVVLFDRFGKGLAFLSGQPIPEQSGLGIWATANTQTLLLLLWLVIIVLTYFITNSAVRKSKKDGWAVILGILNGLVFASIFAPLLTTLIFPGITIQGPVVQLPVLGFLSNTWQQVSNLLVRLWVVIQPVATNVFFLGVVVLILFAALTLRTSVKPKS